MVKWDMEQKCGKCANSGSFLSNDGVDAAGEYFQEYEDCPACVPVATISPEINEADDASKTVRCYGNGR